MKFEWDKISDIGHKTYRAKIIGGWLVLDTSSCHSYRTMIFIPDKKHLWKVDKYISEDDQ